ncbi:response regulator transcription factor [Roseimicrobium sp. ORNL1]|uniref:helix-turn-helix transcriptional regulator n=1 Tax=Roseimicrobium sp. ORNL1 TaxID=2711231 RepID=UPI0013E1ADB9|nr:response regulator transcription factor [Roseimicrobium sp. ORNL1]QIF02826.1 response regulator transcription factor [Roseimicrobium sp. ORNL1]
MSRKRTSATDAGDLGNTALVAAALLEGQIDLPMLAALGVTPQQLDTLFDQGLLESVDANSARLGKKVDAAATLQSTPWSVQRRLHEKIASLLLPRTDRQAEAAKHYAAACCYPEARRLWVKVAEKACAEKRYPEALTSLEEALRIWPADEETDLRIQFTKEMVRCARNCGRLDLAEDKLGELLGVADFTKDHELKAEAHHQLADLALLNLDYAAARTHLQASAELAEKFGEVEEAAKRWFAFASFLADQIRPRESHRALTHAIDLLGSKGAPALLSQLLSYEGLLLSMMGDAASGRKRVEKAMAIAVEHRLEPEVSNAYRRMANLNEYASDYAGERDAHQQAIRLCKKQGAKDGEQSCMMCLSYAFFRMGEWKQAQDTARKVMDDPEAHPLLRAGSMGVRSLIAAFRGEHRQARQWMEESSLQMRRHGVLSLEFHLMWAQGFSFESCGETTAAAHAYGALLDFWSETEDRHDVSPGAMAAAAFFADQGEWKRVAQATDILHAVVNANDNEETRSARLAVLGEGDVGKNDLQAALVHLTASRDGYDRLGTPVERVMVRRRLARLLSQVGKGREAAVEEDAASAIAKHLGMRPLLASVSSQRVSQEKDAGAGAEFLTGRQRDVLQLLADGFTNKEAAERLHLSPRTVEMHVAALLDRLNCRTRAEAIRRAGELKLLG